MDDLSVVLFTVTRVLHVGTAIVLVGGGVFMRFVLMPAASVTLPNDVHAQLRERLMATWRKFVHTGIAVLLISGGINYIRMILKLREAGIRDPVYHGVMGVKILLALALFFIASVLVGRSPRFAGWRQNARTWLAVNIALALIIVALSGYLRIHNAPQRTTPTPTPTPTPGQFAGKTAGQERSDNGLKLSLLCCPPGSFTMGSPKGETDRSDNEDQVSVTLTKGFWLGRTEVTQKEWQAVIGSKPWSGQSYVKEGDDYAATYVSWEDATEFCRKLTDQEHKAGRLPAGWEYTLPTEAQWEYACRAGTKTRFSFGDDESKLGQYGWYGAILGDGNGKTEQYAHEVGKKLPNPWGLRDMHGNVWEWCRDWYAEKLPGGENPEVTLQVSSRLFRGGGWFDFGRNCRSAYRGGVEPALRYYNLGFRVACSQSGG